MCAQNEYYTTWVDNATVAGVSVAVDARAEIGSWAAHAEVGEGDPHAGQNDDLSLSRPRKQD